MRILFYIFLIIFQYFAEILVRVIIIVKSFLGIISKAIGCAVSFGYYKNATIYANSPRPLNKTVAITKPSLTMVGSILKYSPIPHTHLI